MKQLISVRPFLDEIVRRPIPPLDNHWSGLVDGQDIAHPAALRSQTSPVKLSLSAVKTLAQLIEGSAKIILLPRHDSSVRVDFPAGSVNHAPNKCFYRMRSSAIYTTTPFGQDSETLILFAIRLLIHKAPNFSLAYLNLLNGLAQGRPQVELDDLMTTASDELMLACEQTLGLNEVFDSSGYFKVVWMYAIREERDSEILPELLPHDDEETGFAEVLSTAKTFKAFLDGTISLPDALKVHF
jgi:hypothetical protein